MRSARCRNTKWHNGEKAEEGAVVVRKGIKLTSGTRLSVALGGERVRAC